MDKIWLYNPKLQLNYKPNYLLNYGMFLLLTLLSAIGSFIVYSDINRPIEFGNLFLLPLAFAFFSIIFFSVYKDIAHNLAILMIIGFYFARTVLIPVIMRYGDYGSLSPQSFEINLHMDKAIYLIIYELFFVFFTIFLYKNYKNKHVIRLRQINSFSIKSPVFLLGFVFLISFLILTYFVYPQVFVGYSGFISMGRKLSYAELKESTNIIFRNLPPLILKFLQPLYAVFISQLFFNKIKNKKIAIIITITTVLPILNITSSPKSLTIINVLIFSLILYYLYKKELEKFLPLFFLGGSAFTFYALILKVSAWQNTSISQFSLKNIPGILQAYLSGPSNVACGFLIQGHGNIYQLIIDSFAHVPILQYFVKNENTFYKLFNEAFFNHTLSTSQIYPLINYGYYTFGFIFSPIFSVILVLLALNAFKKSQSCENLFMKVFYYFFMINAVLSLIAYNYSIFFNWLITICLPLWIVAKIFNKKRYISLTKENI